MRITARLLLGLFFLGASSWGSALIGSDPGTAQTDEAQPQLEFILQRGEDHLELDIAPEEAIIQVHSERGIGRVTVNRTGGDWPERMLFHLHLDNLEGLTLETSAFHLHTFLRANQTEVRVLNEATGEWEPGEEGDLRIIINQDEMRGVITAEIPRAILEEDIQTFQLQWVDYYRG